MTLVAVNLQETAEQVSGLARTSEAQGRPSLWTATARSRTGTSRRDSADRDHRPRRQGCEGLRRRRRAHFEDQLKEALKAVLTGEKPKEAEK